MQISFHSEVPIIHIFFIFLFHGISSSRLLLPNYRCFQVHIQVSIQSSLYYVQSVIIRQLRLLSKWWDLISLSTSYLYPNNLKVTDHWINHFYTHIFSHPFILSFIHIPALLSVNGWLDRCFGKFFVCFFSFMK